MKILVPTDFSDVAANAFKYAMKISDKMDAEITVLHARSMKGRHEALMVNIDEEIRKNSIQDLQIFIDKVFDGNRPMHIITSEFRVGEPKDVICKYSAKNNFDLIVIGTEVKSALQKILLGTTSSYVLDNARTPVVILPENYSIAQVDHALFTSDMTDVKHEFDQFYNLSKYFIREYEILHVTAQDTTAIKNKYQPIVEELKGEYNNAKINFVVRKNEDVADGVEAHVQAGRTDCIVLFIKKRGFIERLFENSLTQQLADRMMIPIFALSKSVDEHKE